MSKGVPIFSETKTSRNDITGDKIRTGVNSDKYRNAYDLIVWNHKEDNEVIENGVDSLADKASN